MSLRTRSVRKDAKPSKNSIPSIPHPRDTRPNDVPSRSRDRYASEEKRPPKYTPEPRDIPLRSRDYYPSEERPTHTPEPRDASPRSQDYFYEKEQYTSEASFDRYPTMNEQDAKITGTLSQDCIVAIAKQDLPYVKTYLAIFAKNNSIGIHQAIRCLSAENGETLLHLAIRHKAENIVNLLLSNIPLDENGYTSGPYFTWLNKRDLKGNTALHHALHDKESKRFLLYFTKNHRHFDARLRNNDGETAAQRMLKHWQTAHDELNMLPAWSEYIFWEDCVHACEAANQKTEVFRCTVDSREIDGVIKYRGIWDLR